ncbi:MAG TPA: cytochrome c [Steroidobacteraceae bacterium]
MPRLHALWRGLAVAFLALPYTAVLAQSADTLPAAVAPAADVPATAPVETPVTRGKYLADAGNCFSCHTRAADAPFAGGVGFETPFGTIYSSNITPDNETGIGKWSVDDLRRAMHEGIAADGHRLFPAFPYTSYTKVSDEDVAAIYAYLKTLQPVRYTPPGNGLLFSQRWTLAIWNAMFFTPGRFVPDAKQSDEWNRGAYLVEGLGHCSACHAPRDALMAEIPDKPYHGGLIMDKVAPNKVRPWSAVDLTSAKHGLGSWSVNDLTKYLHKGFSTRAGTFGPMNEVIVNSLKKLSAEDVKAMAVYLKSLPASDFSGESVSAEQAKPGEAIYKDRCEKCHSSSGRGGMFSAPPLAGSAVVQSADPASLINSIVYGPETPKDVSFGAWETMHPYGDVLDDSQIAAVSNYIRGSWGNRARPVTAKDVARQR